MELSPIFRMTVNLMKIKEVDDQAWHTLYNTKDNKEVINEVYIYLFGSRSKNSQVIGIENHVTFSLRTRVTSNLW